ncbi:hypothetical protein [Paenibacillus tarimensis]|uniref:hypothetical protein n=1 Tax=Paenibacillus tarimensis TaxID=416012 RepID=UPI001F3173E2|nr:hypothetical protein [Paenibacillus tarimensis]MCF2945073.1 hypothetical protein [Paenibacillus tarimensis]
MKNSISHFFLEWLRALVILFGGLYILWIIEEQLLGTEQAKNYVVLLALVDFTILFLVYRNFLQFSGWFQSKNQRKLPRTVTVLLVLFIILSLSIVMIF